MAVTFDRIGVVVHPRRELGTALATLARWAAEHGADVVQIGRTGDGQEVAPTAEPSACDLVVALGGDGTTLVALQRAAAVGRPVLGVACGSLGALTAVTADRLEAALDRVAAGDWTERALPALVAEVGGERLEALNDLGLVRDGAGQVAVEISVDGELYVRFAGDGLVAATPLGSSAYTLAAGGPLILPAAEAFALTPLSPHGGVCPPLVATAGTHVTILFDAGNGGARVEVDGQVIRRQAPSEQLALELAWRQRAAVLVSLGDQEPLLAALRQRRILIDSPRVLARDDREAAALESRG
jgi:NAD+ kinase